MPRRLKQMPDGSAVGSIGVHDPFELIRHLARSQSDPRKAVAELVQNALDEQATHVTIERHREAGEAVLSILDDGRGVLPELPRKDALTTIATNIGHSRKKQMTFDERMRQAMLGQYGIGLLGFWSPPGPLHAVVLRPGKLELAVGARREVRAIATDEQGRRLREGVTFEWKASAALSVSSQAELATIEGLRPSPVESVEVLARQGSRERVCLVPVRVVSELHRRADAGIPQPEEVSEPLQQWRSRLVDDKWQLNTGHPDYRALTHEARPRLRYLAMLLSKEVVSRNFPQPGVGAVLEELVGLLAALERSGAWGGRSKED